MKCKNCGTDLYDGNINCIKCRTDNTPYLKEAGITANPDAEKIRKNCMTFGAVALVFMLITTNAASFLIAMKGLSLMSLGVSIGLSLVTLVISIIPVKNAITLKETFEFSGRAKVGYFMGLMVHILAATTLFLLLIALAYFLI